jgi:hypothetical protein
MRGKFVDYMRNCQLVKKDSAPFSCAILTKIVESSWNVMAHGDAREGKWRGNWRMEWVASTLHTTSERGLSSITTADAHTSAASSRLNWRLRRFKWTRPFRRKTKSGFCACAITFQTQSTFVVGRSRCTSLPNLIGIPKQRAVCNTASCRVPLFRKVRLPLHLSIPQLS